MTEGIATPATQPTTPPVTTIIPDVGFSAAQVESLLAKARKEEKDKLYGELQISKDSVKTLTEANKVLQESIKNTDSQLQSLKDQIRTSDTTRIIEQLQEEVKALKGDKQVPTTPPVTAPLTEVPNKEVEELKAMVATLTTSVTQLTVANQQATSSQIRAKLLKEAGDELITEMVTGNTAEEITASIEASKKAYQTIYQKAAANAVRIPPANPAGEMNLPSDMKLEDIANMDMAQWAEKRKELLKR